MPNFKFQESSPWSFELELECFVIFKRLEEQNYPRGLQTELCLQLERRTQLTLETIKAKVGNFKSEAGAIGPSHSSNATKYIYSKFHTFSALESQALLRGYQLHLECAPE